MLFRKKIERSCSYCAKRGIMPINGKCMKFRYDPCKRIPAKAKALDFSKYDQEDYTL